MDIVFLLLVTVLFVLAVFDLFVGVSNDAVNFLNSAIGTRAARFRTVIAVAAVGVLLGASTSNGMMDIARHGIFRPDQFAFFDVMCIFVAVMATDVVLLDVFNTLGLPTSTTVSMVFELLGAAFAVALFRLAGDGGESASLSALLNTDKALQVILGIFLSVAIAFVSGSVVGWLTRFVFTFDTARHSRVKTVLFGGASLTAIVWFLLLKGARGMTIVPGHVWEWTDAHLSAVVLGLFIAASAACVVLAALRVNIFRVIVLAGTFSLAMAFAGNDLVNFIGVPLSGLAAWQDFTAAGAGASAATHTMGALLAPARTPWYFLAAAGAVMVVALATSRKARRVSQTEVGLGSQCGSEEMFGSSHISRRVVRLSLALASSVRARTPQSLRRWVNGRFDTSDLRLEHGASFDLVRGAVNLVLSSVLIAMGTALKLPLSTTFVTFMVAMGTSLADRAWGRESAVFRITGVMSVIGGWFITAGAAFLGAALVASVMRVGGVVAIVVIAAAAVVVLVRSNFTRRHDDTACAPDETLLRAMLQAERTEDVWPLLRRYVTERQDHFLSAASTAYKLAAHGFANYDIKALNTAEQSVRREIGETKLFRRRATVCFRRAERTVAIENSTWFHLANGALLSALHSLGRMTEVCREHVDNNFTPLPRTFAVRLCLWRGDVLALLAQSRTALESADTAEMARLRGECDRLKDGIARESQEIGRTVHDEESEHVAVVSVYLNFVLETQEFLSALKKMLRADGKMAAAETTSQGTNSNNTAHQS